MKTVKIPSSGYESNCWLIIDEASGEFAVIDPSPPVDAIDKRIRERGLESDKLRYVLLTHGHFDHIFSADAIREKYSVPLCVHRDDADCLTDSHKNAYKYFFRTELVFKPAEKLLCDGDELMLGNSTVKVLHTPGHTPGSVCYITEDAVYSGDTLFDLGIGRTDLQGGSIAQMTESLKKIISLDGKLNLYPGHGSLSTVKKQLQFNPYLKGL